MVSLGPTRCKQSWTGRVRSELQLKFVLGIICTTLLAFLPNTASAQPGGGQPTENVGVFTIQFWDQGDNGGAGAVDANGNVVANGNLGTWTNEEKAAVRRAFTYWSNTLNAAPTVNPVIRLIKNDNTTTFGGTAISFETAAGMTAQTNTYNILATGGVPATSPTQIDGSIEFASGNGGNFGTNRILQLGTEARSLEQEAIFNIAALLGVGNVDDVNNFVAADGNNVNAPYLNLINPDGNGNNTFQGTTALTIFGPNGLPLPLDGTQTDGVNESFTNLPNHNSSNIANSILNIPHYAPGELAIFDDIGYNGYNPANHFGTAIYQDGIAPQNFAGSAPTADYGIGLFLQADNHVLTQTGNITASGFAATGIRLSDANNNRVNIATGQSITTNGSQGIGVLVSSGSGNTIVQQGTINAVGANGRGYVFAFGVNPFQNVVPNSTVPFVDQLDLTGTINASTNAIQIGNPQPVGTVNPQTPGVGTINVMQGASITGNIFSDAILNGGGAAPMLTFGKLANIDGTATATGNAAFNFTYGGNILGSTDGSGALAAPAGTRAVLDLDFFNGTTTLNGNVTAGNSRLQLGTLNTNGIFNVNALTVDGGTANFAGDTDVVNNVVVNNAGRINATSTFNALDVAINGTGGFVTSGTTLLDDVTVNNNMTMGNGFAVTAGTTTTDQFVLTEGNTVVLSGATLNSNNFTANGGQVDLSGSLNAMGGGGNYTQNAGVLNLSNGGVLTTSGYLQTGGTANVLTGGTLTANTAISNVNGGILNNNGTINTAMGLNINNGGTMNGTGTVNGNVTNNVGGTIAPGNSIGTQNINGNFVTAGNLNIEALPSAAPVPGTDVDNIAVTGTATVNGGTVNVTDFQTPAGATDYTIGTQYNFINATGGVTVNANPMFTDDIANRRLIGIMGANTFGFQIANDTNFGTIGITENQIAFGEYLELVKNTPDPGLQNLRNQIDLLGSDDLVRNAFDQLAGDVYASSPAAALQTTTLLYRQLSRQVAKSTAPSGVFNPIIAGLDETELNINLAGQEYESLIVRGQCDKGTCRVRCRNPKDAWITYYALGGEIDSGVNPTPGEYSSNGTMFGLSTFHNDQVQFGLFGAYGRSYLDTNNPTQGVDSENVHAGAYMNIADCQGTFLAAVGFGYDDYDSQRQVNIGAFNAIANGNYSGQQATAYLERAWDQYWGNFYHRPMVGLQYVHISQDNFVETGAGPANLVVTAEDMDSLRSIVGSSIAWDKVGERCWRLTPEAHAYYMHEFLETSNAIVSGLGPAPAPGFSARGLDTGRDFLMFGTGMTFSPYDSLSFAINYDLQASSNLVLHIGSGNITKVW